VLKRKIGSYTARGHPKAVLDQLDGLSFCMSFATPSQLHLSCKPLEGRLGAGQRRVDQATALTGAASIVSDDPK
jgi:hypothetical protein